MDDSSTDIMVIKGVELWVLELDGSGWEFVSAVPMRLLDEINKTGQVTWKGRFGGKRRDCKFSFNVMLGECLEL